MLTLPAAELALRAKALRLVVTDNDGSLTDGRVWYSQHGEELKAYSLRDGHGVERLREAGVDVCIVTREGSALVEQRGKKLGVQVHAGIRDKLAALPALLDAHRVDEDEIAYFGDDLNDREVMLRVGEQGLTGCPADAEAPIVAIAHHVSTRRGGHGAFRDFAEWMLTLRETIGMG